MQCGIYRPTIFDKIRVVSDPRRHWDFAQRSCQRWTTVRLEEKENVAGRDCSQLAG
jgi:hypothetical protein